jgi:hypothetical protein
MGQGELFALTHEQMERLSARLGSPEWIEVLNELEEAWPDTKRLPLGKNWNLIHSCLSDGTCNPTGGDYPLNRCILGGRHLLPPEDGLMAVLVPPNEVEEVDRALSRLDKNWFRQRYTALFGAEYSGMDLERDLVELEEIFGDLKAFYRNAVDSRQAVLFVTDEVLSSVYRPADD